MADESSETLTWRVHPARQQPGRTALAVATIVVITAFAAPIMGHPAWSVLIIGVLVLALNRFFLPSRFTIDETGITASYPMTRQRYRWEQIKRFGHDEDGAFVSHRPRKSVLDGYTGMHLIFNTHDASRRERIVQRIRSMIAAHQAHQPVGGEQWAG